MESGKLPNGWIRLVGGAPAGNRGITGRLWNHHAADSRAASAGDWVSYEEIRLGAGIRHRGSESLLGVGDAADGFSSILLLPEEHEFALTASCRETGNDLARNICKPYAYTHQRVCNHKNGIFRKYTKCHTIINITARACFAWACSRPSFGVLLLSEEYKLTLMASCGETGNDLAGNRYRPCEYVY